MSLEGLNALEKAWTGCSRLGIQACLRHVNFITAHISTYFPSDSWCQARERCLVAIAEDALDALIRVPKVRIDPEKAQKPLVARDEHTRSVVQQHKTNRSTELKPAPARHNLLGAITRVAGCISGNRDAPWLWECTSSLWVLVNETYKIHKKGDLEPEVPFLWISRAFDNQPPQDNGWRPLPVRGDLQILGEVGVLVALFESRCLYTV
jgi:hypothetical protein